MKRISAAAPGRALLALPACVALVIAGTAAARGAVPASQAAGAPTRALVTVRTLVIDALGTRTVDTDVARVPFGGRGLLMKRVPYAGPPLSFRLEVAAGPPQETGIPLTIAAEVWNGELASPPPSASRSRREEATVVSAEGSYLFEIDHDERSDRRVVLSLSARPAADLEGAPALPSASEGAVALLVDVSREIDGRTELLDNRRLDTRLGLPVSYSSGVRLPPARAGGELRFVGFSVTLTPERAQGELITVGLQLTGADFLDEAGTRLEPFSRAESHTVSSGTPFTVVARVPGGPDPPSPGTRTVSYRVTITPTLGP